MTGILGVKNITCQYDELVVVKDLSFNLQPGDIGCLLGPSGCGKSTILRAIAGFEPLRSGTIELNGNAISAPNNLLAPEKRHIGMVFQDYALFPHLTIAENIRFGLKQGKSELSSKKVQELIELVDQ